MKRLLFSLIALIIMGGYIFAQNEAYVQQLGASAGVGVQIYQNGTGNKLFGPGTVPTVTPVLPTGDADFSFPPIYGAAKITGASNELSVYQDMDVTALANIGWVNQAANTNGGDNKGTLKQVTAANIAIISQTATGVSEDNTFDVLQSSSTKTGINKARLIQSGFGDNYAQTRQLADGNGNNFYNVEQSAPAGENTVDGSAIVPYFNQVPQKDGIYQKGYNRVDNVTFNGVWSVEDGQTRPSFQTATLGDNYMTIVQNNEQNVPNYNIIALQQDATTGDNVVALWQHGSGHKVFSVQSGTSNILAGHQAGVGKIMSIHQVSTSSANTAIFTQLQ